MSGIKFDARVNTPKDFTVDMGRATGGGSDPKIYLVGTSYPKTTTEHAAVASGEALTATITPSESNRGKIKIVGEITFLGDSTPSQSDNGEIIIIGPQIVAGT